MRIRISKTPLPRSFAGHPEANGLLLDHDLGVRRGRLKAKLLVFDTSRNMRRFWKRALGRPDLTARCLGVASDLGVEVTSFEGGRERQWREVDPRYVCVIGLVKTHLTMEIISHEACHAGIYFARRAAGNWAEMAGGQGREDDERICYPSGRIAAAINRALDKNNLYPS